MYRRDYFKKQIDQLGRVLGKLFSDLLGLKNEGKMNEGIEITNETLKGELDLNLDELSLIPEDDFIRILQQKKVTSEGLEQLAEILLLFADEFRNDDIRKAEDLYKKVLLIYNDLDKSEDNYSFDRHIKRERVINLLS